MPFIWALIVIFILGIILIPFLKYIIGDIAIKENLNFETAMKQLEEIANQLEKNDLDLDKAIDIYTTKGVDGAEDNAARYASDIKEMWQQNLDNIFKEQGSGFNELLANIMSALTPNKIENINKLSPIEKRRAQYSFFLNSTDEVITKEAEITTKLSDLLDYFRKQLIQNFNTFPKS